MIGIGIIDIVTSASLIIMILLVRENIHIDKKVKKRFYFTYICLFIAMFAEWAGLILNGASEGTFLLHKIVKVIDYIFTPIAGYMIVAQISKKDSVHSFVKILLCINALVQVISIFTGWTFYLDEFNFYHHGPFYTLYIVVYLLVLFCVFYKFYEYGKNYKNRNRASLVSIILLIILGIILQEGFGYRVSYLVLSISAYFLFVHYSEFIQVVNAENYEYRIKLLETDPLSELYSRYAYTDALKELEENKKLLNGLVVFSIDVNELKSVNDTFGHLAGDELIKGAASCIRDVLEGYGMCYRTGGDEFIAFIYTSKSHAYQLKKSLIQKADQWHGKLADSLSVSVGYAICKENQTIEELIHIADDKMYEDKAQYYSQRRRDRRVGELAIQDKQKEYMDIISAFASDLTGLYVIDRAKQEVTAYRLSASDHRIRSSVPLEQGFDVAMNTFVEKYVHPDDRALMYRGIQFDFIEQELSTKQSFMYHFRTVKNGEIFYHYMKCIRNIDDEEYDKIIICFCPENNLALKKSVQDALRAMNAKLSTVLLVMDQEEQKQEIMSMLQDQHNLVTVESGEKAIDLLREQHSSISAILYQDNLSDMNCISFLQTIHEDIFLSSIPVIILEDHFDKGMEYQCIQLGAIDFVCAPYNSIILKHRLNNVISFKNTSDSLDEIEMDDLTGIYTRQAFLYHANTLIEASPNESFTILISDIQNFRIYNAVYGEAKGDELLKNIAKHILTIVQTGLCARYGADQFVLIFKKKKEIDEYVKEAQNIIDFELKENIKLRFGFYENVDRNLTVSQMCDRALLALRSIKHSYDKQYACFDEPVSQRQYRANMYEAQFKQALENNEFVVWYQPKYNPFTEKIVAAEALVRWQTKDGRIIPPSEFLPEFEINGLISQLDEYVFRTACEQQRKWKDRNQELIPISVNLSRNSIYQMNIVKRYREICEYYNISPKMLPIEITESATIENIEIKPLADAFIEAGFSLQMDDFGSGKSSMTGLALLRFDAVKLDKSLIDCIGEEHGNLVLMYTVALGKELGLGIVAEGVETKEQLEYLKDIGCEIVQGYYYSRPLPVNEFEETLKQNLEKEVFNVSYEPKRVVADSVAKRAMDRILQRMPGGFFTYRHDENEEILSSNGYLWNLFGCQTEEEFMEYVGGSFKGMVCPDDLERVETYIERQINGDILEMDYVEYDIISKDGTIVSVVDYGHLEHQSDGDVFYVFISESDKK